MAIVRKLKEQHMFKTSMGFVPALGAAVLAATASASATAAGDWSHGGWSDQPPSVTVRYDDLNLATRPGRSALYERLKHAAQKVCPDAEVSDLAGFMRAQNCQIAAVQRAVRAIGGPTVAQLQAEHGLAQERTVSQD
jgi:UrcA family protein